MFKEENTVFVSSHEERQQQQQQHHQTTSFTTTMLRAGQNPSLYKEPDSDMCRRCAKFIYPLESLGPVMGSKYHKLCFRCVTCNRLLDFKTYRTNLIELSDKSVYCSTHNPKNGKVNVTETVVGNNRTRSKSPAFVVTIFWLHVRKKKVGLSKNCISRGGGFFFVEIFKNY
jgi:hypothetical protein